MTKINILISISVIFFISFNFNGYWINTIDNNTKIDRSI